MKLPQQLLEFNGCCKSVEQLEADFNEIAKSAIFGGYFLVNNKIAIYIHEVEFYFHSENPLKSKIFDYSMYHRGNDIDYFPIGSLHPHKSGVDVTFEKEGQYRASFLIRKYQVKGETNIINTPTYLREDLFGYTGCVCGDGPKIVWVDNSSKINDDLHLIQNPRINITAYDEIGNILFDNNGKKMKDSRLWRFSRP